MLLLLIQNSPEDDSPTIEGRIILYIMVGGTKLSHVKSEFVLMSLTARSP